MITDKIKTMLGLGSEDKFLCPHCESSRLQITTDESRVLNYSVVDNGDRVISDHIQIPATIKDIYKIQCKECNRRYDASSYSIQYKEKKWLEK